MTTTAIRESRGTDKESIRQLHRSAFGEAESKAEGELVSQLAIDLLEDPTASPVLSLVAEQDDAVVGNVIFTAVRIDGNNLPVSAHIMAPLAVATKFQGEGIGKKLIELGLQKLKERGTEVVLVLGDPAYYTRRGFSPDHNLKPPYKLGYPEEAWMAVELKAGALTNLSGTVECATSLQVPEYW